MDASIIFSALFEISIQYPTVLNSLEWGSILLWSYLSRSFSLMHFIFVNVKSTLLMAVILIFSLLICLKAIC